MRKVITGNLNGNAYQFEEPAFEAVRTYLDNAAAKFTGNPDRAEILADLEQAIADKCDTFLGRHKTVVSLEEARHILRAMGPVEGNAPERGESSTSAGHAAAAVASRRRRLYRLPREGMLGGVCAGLAASFDVDVVWVRLAYVLLTFATGIWFFVWLVQLCITPKAITAEEIAAAHGEPLTAREVLERARKSGRAAADGLRDAGQNLRDALGR
jgi:phage shock protein PspC (stress-responsive transcriptional regulator)